MLAAGHGRRFGGLKQFASVNGRPLLYYALRAFEDCAQIHSYVVVARRGNIPLVRQIARQYRLDKLRNVVAGGNGRRQSVAAGLGALPERGIVAVHDGVRPFVTVQMLNHGIAACRRYGAAVYAIPLTDTLKRVKASRVLETIDRTDLFCAQTPQFFRMEILRCAHKHVPDDIPATDDSALLELMGIRPVLLPGTSGNIKVTTRDDIRICEALL